MPKVKVRELGGAALDWAVVKCEDKNIYQIWSNQINVIEGRNWIEFSPSTDWAQGGPIMDENEIGTWPPDEEHPHWTAGAKGVAQAFTGTTRLIAAMRCYVASQLGEEIEVPMKLFKG